MTKFTAPRSGATHIIQCAPGEHLLPLVDGAWQFEDLLALRLRVESFGLRYVDNADVLS